MTAGPPTPASPSSPSIRPGSRGPDILAHVETLFERLLADGDARLPGDRRIANRARTAGEGITVEDTLYATVCELAGRA